MAFDFRAWLDTKPDDEHYDYMNSTGECAVGQWMTACGEKWSMSRYSSHVKELFPKGIAPLAHSTTFGQLKKQLVAA